MEVIEIPAENVPQTAFCHCPMKRFALVRIKSACCACPHFAGFVEFNRRADEFENRLRPLCAHPIARAIVTVEA
jgi:hypothetical protein